MNIDKLKKYIQSIEGLDNKTKENFIEKLNDKLSLTQKADILEQLQQEIRKQIDNKFKEAGVEEAFDDENYQKKFDKVEGELNAAEKDFSENINKSIKEIDNWKDETEKKLQE